MSGFVKCFTILTLLTIWTELGSTAKECDRQLMCKLRDINRMWKELEGMIQEVRLDLKTEVKSLTKEVLKLANKRKENAVYLGCFKDSTPRDLPLFHQLDSAMTVEKCNQMCRTKGYKYAGSQTGSQCFCGDEFGSYRRVPETSCASSCHGDFSKICGGSWTNSVYFVGK
ncbi:unnamed protein product [Owenia fusiformis]|uniref:WSC domain-containing protein n=1 Tax=Owenia fusiformis TaxID=6347 RepID=A0A8S4NZS5_OWEFU|nr:unnamed protein product [Owenia fusiformis]